MKEQIIQLPDNLEVKEIKDGKIILIEKEKKLTYEDIAKKLFADKKAFYIDTHEIAEDKIGEFCAQESNNCTSRKQAEKLLAINKLMNVAKYLNEDWQPDWNNIGAKYCININNDKIEIDFVSTKCYGDIYFRSKELAEQAIEILGEKTIRLALCTDY